MPPQIAIDQPGRIETRGVEHIPLDERNSSPWNVALIAGGQAFAPTIIALGWLPVVFGLSWWGAVTSTLIGVGAGSLIVSGVGLLGPRTGTSSAVSSGAMFGVRGRLIGSILGQTGGLGFYALTVWAGGTVLVGVANRLFGLPESALAYIVVYVVLGILSVIVAIWGHASLLAANKWFVVPVSGAVMVLGLFWASGSFDSNYAGGHYLLGSFWPTWWLATVIAGGAVTLSLFVNDWTRRIDPRKTTPARQFSIVFGGCFVGASFAMLFGAYFATMFPPTATSWGQGFTDVAPAAYMVIFAIVVAFGGTMVHATVDLYSGGLDLSSMILRLKRVPATIGISIAGLIVVVLATIVWDAQSSLTAYVTFLTVACTTWAAVLITGHILVKGRYDVDDLQVLNLRTRGGIYWYQAGWNLWACAAWFIGTFVGCMFINTSLFVGPFAGAFGGVDLSWILGGVISAVIFSLSGRSMARPEYEEDVAEAQAVRAMEPR